jgi:hypothetical protein
MTRVALAIATLAVLALLAVRANAEQRTTTFRDALGREVGRAERQGGRTTFYDRMGRQTGRAERRPDGYPGDGDIDRADAPCDHFFRIMTHCRHNSDTEGCKANARGKR